MKVTADDIAQLLASPPPRQVPAHVTKAAKTGGASWGTALFGVMFGAFGMIFVVVFFPWQFWDEGRLAGGAAQSVSGVVTRAERAHMRINGREVMAYRFTYAPGPGARLTGQCFSTDISWPAGAAVMVRYLPAEPAVACIEGMRLSKAGWMGSWVIIFPGLGFAMAGWFVVQRRQISRLLRGGMTAEVDVLSVEATNTQVNNRQVYKIVLSSPALGGQPVTVRRLNQAEINLAGRHAAQKQPAFVLYDPRQPKRLLFPEALIEV